MYQSMLQSFIDSQEIKCTHQQTEVDIPSIYALKLGDRLAGEGRGR